MTAHLLKSSYGRWSRFKLSTLIKLKLHQQWNIQFPQLGILNIQSTR